MNGICISHKLKGAFRVVCILTTISLSALWLFRYSQDKDITLVDYKDTDVNVRPIVSLCLSYPFLLQKLQDTGVVEPNDLRNTLFNLNDYITRFQVLFRNGSSSENEPRGSHGNQMHIIPTFTDIYFQHLFVLKNNFSLDFGLFMGRHYSYSKIHF